MQRWRHAASGVRAAGVVLGNVRVAACVSLLCGVSSLSMAFAEAVDIERLSPLALMLPGGHLIVMGGQARDEGGTLLRSYLRVDVNTKRVVARGVMDNPHFRGRAVNMSDGRVLVIGGLGSDYFPTRSVELFDPAENSFATVCTLRVPRAEHSATLLSDGRVLVAGGRSDTEGLLSSAEIIDVKSLSARVLPSRMACPRRLHTATALKTGEVLLAGGMGDGTQSAELFDPAKETFTEVGTLRHPRVYHSAALLEDGTVFLFSGTNGELFVPETKESRVVEPTVAPGGPRDRHTATRLESGDVLIVGGRRGGRGHPARDTPFLFRPEENSFVPLAESGMDNRHGHAAVAYRNNVLIIGGEYERGGLVVCYDSKQRSFSPVRLEGLGTGAKDSPGYADGRAGGIRLVPARGPGPLGPLVTHNLFRLAAGGDGEAERVRKCTSTGRPLGGREFVAGLEEEIGRPLAPRRPGRKPRRRGI